MARGIPRRLALLLPVALAPLLQGCGGGKAAGAAPVLSSVTPSTGTISTTVTIAGTGLLQSGSGTSAVDPTVTFTPSAGGAGVQAKVISFGPTSLDVSVPAVSASLAAAGTEFDIAVANPGGGSATLHRAFTMAAPTVTDLNGGLAGSGTVNSLFILDGSAFGDLSAAPPSGYSVDFRDAGGAVVASASVDWLNDDWQDIFIVGTVPGGLAASTTYQVTVTTPSGTSAPLDFLVAGSISFSPSTILWTATSSLPAARGGFPVLVVPIAATSGGTTTTTTYVYALGGNTTGSAGGSKASNVATVSYDQMAATGALANAAWSATTSLPDVRGFAAAVSANSFDSLVAGNGNLYVLGGLDGTGAATDTVYYASLAADGTVPAPGTPGTWATTTPLPQPLFAAGAVIFHGRIYLAGGNDSTGTPVAKVYSAKINADGTLGAWDTTLPDLPVALAYHQLVTSAGYLYALGGDSAAVDPLSDVEGASIQGGVYYDAINIRTGALGASWIANASSLGKSREKFSAVVAGGYVLVSGGLYSAASTGSSEQSYAPINADGSLGSFNGATGVHTISGSTGGYNFFNHAGVLFVDPSGNPHVLVVGGQDVNTGSPVSGVWYQH